MMHLKTLLLLAVQSSVITAAVLRRGLVTRSFNQSAIDDAAVQPVITDAPTLSSLSTPPAITTKQIGSVPAAGSGSGAAKIDEEDIVSANTEPPEPLNTSKQVGIVPAVGSGPGAATLPAAEVASANTEAPVLSSTAFPSATSSSSPSAGDGEGDGEGDGVGNDSVATASKQIGIVPAVGSGPGAATLPAADVASANTNPPEPFSTTTTVPSTTPLPSFLRRSQESSDIPTPSFSSSLPTAPTNTNAPAAGNNNADMAQRFNQFFDTMNSDSTCNPGIESQRQVCIDKKTAECGVNGRYTLSACSQNEICRAVPLDGGQTGIAIKCVPEPDTSPSSPSESAAPSQTVVSAVSPSSSLGEELPTVIFATRTIIVNPVPTTTVQAEPTLSKSVVSGFFSKFTSLEGGLPTAASPEPIPTKSMVSGFFSKFTSLEGSLPTAVSPEPIPTKSVVSGFFSKFTSLEGRLPTAASPEPIPTKSVVSGFFSKFTSLEGRLPTAAAPEPTPTKSVISGMFSFLASLENGSPTPTNFLTVATPTSSDVPPPTPTPPPQETPPPAPSPTTSDQPAIVIEPQSRNDAKPTDCPHNKSDPHGAGSDGGCFVVHG